MGTVALQIPCLKGRGVATVLWVQWVVPIMSLEIPMLERDQDLAADFGPCSSEPLLFSNFGCKPAKMLKTNLMQI